MIFLIILLLLAGGALLLWPEIVKMLPNLPPMPGAGDGPSQDDFDQVVADLEEAERKYAELDTEAQQRFEENRRLSGELEVAKKEIGGLKASAGERERTIASQAAELQTHRSIDERERDIRIATETNRRAAEGLEEKRQKLGQLETNFGQTESKLADLDRGLKTRQQLLDDLATKLEQQKALQEARQSEQDARDSQITERETKWSSVARQLDAQASLPPPTLRGLAVEIVNGAAVQINAGQMPEVEQMKHIIGALAVLEGDDDEVFSDQCRTARETTLLVINHGDAEDFERFKTEMSEIVFHLNNPPTTEAEAPLPEKASEEGAAQPSDVERHGDHDDERTEGGEERPRDKFRTVFDGKAGS